MARPRTPLISREKTLETALRLIDEEGLDAVTMRRLGQELSVRGVSLYHHFKDKDAILSAACGLAFEKVRTPNSAGQEWDEWLYQSTLDFFDILSAHPNLIPIMMGRHSPRNVGLPERNLTAGLLAVQGVPEGIVMPLIEALEEVALGAAGYQSAINGEELRESWRNEYPFLNLMQKKRGHTKREMVALMARVTIAAVKAGTI